MSTDVLSEALVGYLGAGRASSPQRDSAWLLAKHGAVTAALLETALSALLVELDRLEFDWTGHSLVTGTEAFEAEVRTCHPDLSEAAVRALGWRFSFMWR